MKEDEMSNCCYWPCDNGEVIEPPSCLDVSQRDKEEAAEICHALAIHYSANVCPWCGKPIVLFEVEHFQEYDYGSYQYDLWKMRREDELSKSA